METSRRNILKAILTLPTICAIKCDSNESNELNRRKAYMVGMGAGFLSINDIHRNERGAVK